MSDHELPGRLAALTRARQHVDVAWSDERVERAAGGLPARLSAHLRRRQLRQGGILVLLAGALAASVVGGWAAFVPAPGGPAAPTDRGLAGRERALERWTLQDGSRLESLMAGTTLTARPEQQAEQRVELARGRARFTVAHRPGRRFVVSSGGVDVVVVGTRFVVQRDAREVRVNVEEGRVRVRGPGGMARLLGAGESVVLSVTATPASREAPATEASASEPPAPGLPPAAPAPPAAGALPADAPPGTEPAVEPPVAPSRAPKSPRASSREPIEGPDWRTLARAMPGPEALAALGRVGLEKLRTPADLLLAADLGRATRSFDLAARALRLLVSRHPTDPLAPLGAFTLGRLLLEQQGQPAEAAAAFARARALAPQGALAADALAREVDSWALAGHAARARQRAEEYVRRHPTGPHRRAVERHVRPQALPTEP